MPLSIELDELADWVKLLPHIGRRTIGEAGSPIYHVDLIMIAAVKRSLSLASGMIAMVQSKNMVCARAILRMQIDTVSRLLAYTYVDNPALMAKALIGGTPLKKFKCRDGKALLDGYLVDRMTKSYPWTRNVYDFTSGYVHFSEQQLFDSVHSVGEDQNPTLELQISHVDNKFPDSSWEECAACFNQLLRIVEDVVHIYSSTSKNHQSPAGGCK